MSDIHDLEEQLEVAKSSGDWAKVAELAQQMASYDPVETPKKRGRKPATAKKTTSKSIDHQKWHAEHLYAPVSVPNRPNKFQPEKDTKKYIVPNQKRFGEFAGRVYENEEAYLREAVYGAPTKHDPPPAKRITVVCNGCGSKTKIFESELMIYNEAGGYKCDKCISNRRKTRIGDDD